MTKIDWVFIVLIIVLLHLAIQLAKAIRAGKQELLKKLEKAARRAKAAEPRRIQLTFLHLVGQESTTILGQLADADGIDDVRSESYEECGLMITCVSHLSQRDIVQILERADFKYEVVVPASN